MKQSLFTMEHARQLTEDTYELVLSGDTSAVTAPGQFVNISLPGNYLRRPISICNWDDQGLLLLVKVVGKGTHDLVRCVPGTELDVLSGLGNGFDPSLAGEHPVLAGGAIEPGAPADLAVLDLNRPHTIDAAAFRSLGHATPFDGWGVGAAVALTICGGEIVHHDLGNEEEL